MKRISQSLGAFIPTVNLLRSDLDEIIHILKNDKNEIEIISRNIKYDSLDELKDNIGNNLSELHILSHTPYISLEFKGNNPILQPVMPIWLYAADNSSNAAGSFYRIKELLLKRRSFISKILPFWISVIGILFIYFAPSEWIRLLLPARNIRIAVSLLVLILIIIPLSFRMGFFYSISLSKEAENTNFLNRKKDDIILLLIGSGITLLCQWLYKLLMK